MGCRMFWNLSIALFEVHVSLQRNMVVVYIKFVYKQRSGDILPSPEWVNVIS